MPQQAWILCVGVLSLVFADRVHAVTLQWDHPEPKTVVGFIVSVDETRTDHGLKVLGERGRCGCSLTLNLSPGKHVIVVSAYNKGGERASMPLTFTIGSDGAPARPPVLPKPWLTQDIGEVSSPGVAAIERGTVTIAAAGADIWGTADSFHYLHQPIGGNGTVVARVTSIERTHPNAKAGVMIRDSTKPDAAHAILNATPPGVIEFLVRDGSGRQTISAGNARQPMPAWLRLSRVGDTITAAFSQDGNQWTTVGTTTLKLTRDAQMGLAAASLVPGKMTTAVFDSVSISSDGTAGAQSPGR